MPDPTPSDYPSTPGPNGSSSQSVSLLLCREYERGYQDGRNAGVRACQGTNRPTSQQPLALGLFAGVLFGLLLGLFMGLFLAKTLGG